MNRVIFFGSRSFSRVYERHVFERVAALPADWIIVHGACPTGADAFAARAAELQGRPVEAYPADWASYGASAGPRRNEGMADLPGVVLGVGYRAQGKSNGTDGMRALLEGRGVPVERYGWGWT